MFLVIDENMRLCLYMQRKAHSRNNSDGEYTNVNGVLINIIFMTLN